MHHASSTHPWTDESQQFVEFMHTPLEHWPLLSPLPLSLSFSLSLSIDLSLSLKLMVGCIASCMYGWLVSRIAAWDNDATQTIVSHIVQTVTQVLSQIENIRFLVPSPKCCSFKFCFRNLICKGAANQRRHDQNRLQECPEGYIHIYIYRYINIYDYVANIAWNERHFGMTCERNIIPPYLRSIGWIEVPLFRSGNTSKPYRHMRVLTTFLATSDLQRDRGISQK